MRKLSPRYRNDPDVGIDPAIETFLDENYFAHLPNLHVENPKLLVVFAGGSAVGKSTLARKIAEELHGLRLENDGIKRVLLEKYPELKGTDELHHITWQYSMSLYRRLDALTHNGLIIRDGIITWYFDRILPIFESAGYEQFTIAYDLSEEKMRELIRARGDTPTTSEERLYTLIPDQQIHLKRYLEHYQPDITLHDNNVFDHDLVLEKIDKKLAELKI
ncbi:MAG: AAA family ATPase [Candidatus Saccharimonadales bacterium]